MIDVQRLQSISRTMIPRVALDVGTASTRLQVWGEEQVVRQTSVLATHDRQRRVVLVGEAAQQVEGRVSQEYTLHHLVRGGVVARPEELQVFLRHMLSEALGRRMWLRPRVMASVASHASQLQRELYVKILESAGAREVYLIDQPLAAAIGAEVPVAHSGGNMVIHLGAGVTEVALIALGGIVCSQSFGWGGEQLDREIQQWIAQQYQLEVSVTTARQVREAVKFTGKNANLKIIGKPYKASLPQEVSLPLDEVLRISEYFFQTLFQTIQKVCRMASPEVATDLVEKGVILTGGLANWTGIDRVIAHELKLPVVVAEEPEQCVMNGCLLALEHLDEFKKRM